MKKLYALLVILIVIYVGINVGVNGVNIFQSDGNLSTITNSVNLDVNNNNNNKNDANFPKLENFTQTKVNDTTVKYLDNKTGVNIEVQKINNSLNLSQLYSKLVDQGIYTSSQKIDQKGVTAYFLYKEGQTTYDTDIYFNKNKQNYKISGYNTTYEKSDYFINNCKYIIDTL